MRPNFAAVFRVGVLACLAFGLRLQAEAVEESTDAPAPRVVLQSQEALKPAPPTPSKQSPSSVTETVHVESTIPGRATSIELLFAYGSEKKSWIEEVTNRFNRSGTRISSGESIFVKTNAAGSGEIIEDLLSGKSHAHLVSPAALAFVTIGNGKSREADAGDLIGQTRELVRSPIVLAIWSDLAESARWRKGSVTWRKIFDAAREPKRWGELTRKPGVGQFRLGHTDPENSNSGLHALFLISYAATGKFDGQLTRGELIQPEFLRYLREVEAAVPHPLKSSTGFLAKSMIDQGPTEMTAAIVYENLVIEANRLSPKGPAVIAIYPREGTFQSEHPVGIVNRSWVSPKHHEAAQSYISYLLDRPQQEKAKAHGFRPSDASIRIDDMLKPEFGVSVAQPRTLPTPSATLITTIRNQWRQTLISNLPPAGTQRNR
jgi:Ca-activated chloride channel family protein